MNDCFMKNVLLIKSKMTKTTSSSMLNKQTTIGPLRNSMGKLTNNVHEMSDILINQFEKTISTPKSNMTITDKSTLFDSTNDSDLKDIIITEQLIENAINSTSCHSAAGIDGISPILLRECAQ